MILLKSKVGKYILKHVKASLTEGKSIILDAFALLGGNENLVYKIMVELEDTSYRYKFKILFRCC